MSVFSVFSWYVSGGVETASGALLALLVEVDPGEHFGTDAHTGTLETCCKNFLVCQG